MSFSDFFNATSGIGDAFIDARNRAEAIKLNEQQLLSLQGQGQTPLSALGASVPAGAPAAPRLGQLGQPVATPSFASAGGGDIGDYLNQTRARESGGNDLAANPNSTAKGRYQFTDDTWKNVAKAHPELGLQPGGWRDPGQQEKAMQAFTADNAKQLTAAGIPINPANLYGAHFLGAGGARQFIPAAINSPDAPAVQFVSPGAARANRSVFYNKDGSPKTAGQVYSWLGGSRGQSAPAATPTLPQQAPRQVANADPEADIPAAGAMPVGFQPPAAQSGEFEPGSVASPAITNGSAGALPAVAGQPRITPERVQLLRQMLQNPLTAPQAQAEIQRLSAPPKTEYKELGGRVVRTDDRGNISAVPGFEKPEELKQFKGADGNDYLYSPRTGRTTRLVEGKPTNFTDLVTPQDRDAAGVPKGYEGSVQRGPDGQLHYPGKPSTSINLDQKGESAFATTANKGIAERFLAISTEGDSARSEGALLGQLRGLGDLIGTGPQAAARSWLADKGIKLGDNIGAVEAYGSLVDKLVPAQRVPGSGTTSDFDAKGFKASLPRLLNTPEGNALIIGTLEAVNDWKVQRAAIAERGLTGELKPGEVMKQLTMLPNPNTAFRSGLSELQKTGKLGAESPKTTDTAKQPPSFDRSALEAEARRRGIIK